jgi:uncharacterized DUF497 family protein
MSLEFEWDPQKATTNLRKHSVSFKEAATVFGDPLAAIFVDDDHPNEFREIIIGHSDRARLLVVSFSERSGRTRVISARRTTARERRDYEENIAK